MGVEIQERIPGTMLVPGFQRAFSFLAAAILPKCKKAGTVVGTPSHLFFPEKSKGSPIWAGDYDSVVGFFQSYLVAY